MRIIIKTATIFGLLSPTLFIFLTTGPSVQADAGCDCASATYTNTVPQNAGGQRNIQMGETLCITDDTVYTENIARLEGSICVEPTATYEVNQNYQYYSGTITNYGETLFNASLNMSGSATFINYGNVTASQNASFNINDNALIVNQEDANFTFNSGVTLGGTSTIQNAGVFTLVSHVNIHSTVTIENSGLFTAKNNVALAGNISNTGEFYMLGVLNLNTGASLTNECRMVSSDGFVNNSGSEIINNGLIYELPTNTPLEDGNTSSSSDTFQNNGTWVNGTDGIVYGVDFSSSGTVTGGGTFYFEDYTRLNGGSFGVDTDTDVINFYDAGMACSGAGDGPNGEFDDAPSWLSIEETTCLTTPEPTISYFPSTCSLGALNLKVTVGTDASECSLADEVLLDAPSDAYYCYTIENLSGMDVTVTSLVDDQVDLSAHDLGLPVTLNAIDENSLEVDTHTILLSATSVNTDLVNSAIASGFDMLGAPLFAGDSAVVDLVSAPTNVEMSSSQVDKGFPVALGIMGLGFFLALVTLVYVGRKRSLI